MDAKTYAAEIAHTMRTSCVESGWICRPVVVDGESASFEVIAAPAVKIKGRMVSAGRHTRSFDARGTMTITRCPVAV